MGRLRRVEFIWTCRETGSFGWIKDLLEDLEDAQQGSGFLRISVRSFWVCFKGRELISQIYLTQKLSKDEMHNIVINE
jgi:NADPH oxidase